MKEKILIVDDDADNRELINILEPNTNECIVYMLDVSGHGVPAAMVSLAVYQSLQTKTGLITKQSLSSSIEQPTASISPKNVLEALDKEYPMERFNKYFSISYLVVNSKESSVTYCNAGHPPPLILHPDGYIERMEKGGTIIGMNGIVSFEEEQKKLHTGDRVIMYTDGVTEFQNAREEIYGEKNFHLLLHDTKDLPVDKMLDEVMNSLLQFGNNTPLKDDVSLLAFEFKG
ncbi:MAG: serine/threonine-protein phosphatase [Planctomycetes bacterium]|nr:serine/threonine-protein phosphatase [Planctomycetota bacterium]